MSEAAVRAVEAAYDAAWSAGDLEAVIRCLTPDAVVVNPRGEECRGAADVRRMLGDFLASEAPGSRHESSLIRIVFVREDVALVDGRARITFADGGLLEHPFTDVVVRSEGRWAIAQTRAYTA